MKQERAEVKRWAVRLDALHARVGQHFARTEPRQRVKGYLQALLSGVDRKNGWQIAEQVGEATPYGTQRLLASARWDEEAVRDELRAYAVESLGEADGVLVLDETGFLKQGKKSVGVARQYSGTAGKVENCQIGVFLAYTTPNGTALIDRALYLPKPWAQDSEHREESGVPTEVPFQTKPQLAQAMLARAFAAGMRPAWVVADEVYGRDRLLRMDLEAREQPFVLTVASNERLWYGGIQQVAAAKIAASLDERAWQTLSAGAGE